MLVTLLMLISDEKGQRPHMAYVVETLTVVVNGDSKQCMQKIGRAHV